MSSQDLNQYRPDAVTPPGFYIQEKLEELGMTQTALAARIGRTKKTVNEIITGKAPIEPETALQMERVLGIPARFWNNAERQYRDHLARRAERTRLEQQQERLQSFPINAMSRFGWLPKRTDRIEILSDLLSFFGVATFETLDQLDHHTCAAFRQSVANQVKRGAVLAWLRKGELEARSIECHTFNKDKFRSTLLQIRSLTLRPIQEALPQTAQLCAASGVAMVIVPELPGTRTWGATRWLTPDKALIQLSARGKTDDQLWFTFFHEAGHILMHPKKDIFVELGEAHDAREDEANRFAADQLIPPDTWVRLRQMKPRSSTQIAQLAQQYHIAPGILVGRMQREEIIPWSNLNGLKTRLSLAHGLAAGREAQSPPS